MNAQPLVSIITIVYNGEKHLEQTIQSVLQQSYPAIDYIIIDGGSSDNTLNIVRKYEQKLRWISEKDQGIADAFNKGIQQAKGEIVGIINADDWYEPSAVENAVAGLRDSDIVYGDLCLYKGEKPDHTVIGNHEYLEREMTINHPTVFIRKSCYDRLGLFDIQYKSAMDYDLALRFKTRGCRFWHIPTLMANMRWEGFSDVNWMLACRETLAIKNKYLPRRKLLNRLYFIKHVAAIAIPKFLQRIHLDFIVRAYRTRFALLKKHY